MIKAIVVMFLGIVGLIVAAATCQTTGDPWTLSAQAEATQDMAQARVQATGQALESMTLAQQGTSQAAEINQQGTSQAAALESWQSQATSTAAGQATSQALVIQATSQALAVTATSQAMGLQATQAAYLDSRAQAALDLERARQTNQIRAWAGYAILVLAVAAIVALTWVVMDRATRVKHIRPDEKGALGVLVVGDRVIDPGLLVASVADMTQPNQPYITGQEALYIKSNQQKIQALQALPAGDLPARTPDLPASPVIVEVLEPDHESPILAEVETKLLASQAGS